MQLFLFSQAILYCQLLNLRGETNIMIEQEQVRFFQQNGYLKYGPVLNMDEVEELRDGLDRVIQIELNGGDNSEPEFHFGHRRDNDSSRRAITQFVNMWKREPAYERLLHHPTISGVLCALLNTSQVRLWHDQIISKPPDDNDHFQFHQDFYFWPLDRPEIVTCWLALDDATIDSGCMHVIPESHVDPRFDPDAHTEEQRAKEAKEITESERDKISKQPASFGKPIEIKAGECMFHHCLNFHATPPNVTENQRRAHIMIFMAKGTRVNLSQSGGHVLVPGFEVGDGEELVGKGFPASDPKLWDNWHQDVR